MLAKAFGPNSIAISQSNLSWEQALCEAVGLLEKDRRVEKEYLNQVLSANRELGPYFVVAPGIAIAHAAPSKAVLTTGFALLRLDVPVSSGSLNDPVRLLFAFAAVDAESHIDLLSEFAVLMSNPANVNILLNEPNLTNIRNLLQK